MNVARSFHDRLTSYKAITLTGLALTLAPLLCAAPAHAQMPMGTWQPVDANGNFLNGNYNYAWPLLGVPSGSPHDTYNSLAEATGTAFWSSPFPSSQPLTPMDGINLITHANNYWTSGYYGYYGAVGNPAVAVTGSITEQATNQMSLRLKWVPFSYPYPGAPPPAPAPDHIDLLVNTYLNASASGASAPYIGTDLTLDGLTGRTASATASMSPFGGSVTATYTDKDPHNPAATPPPVIGYYLKRVQSSGGVAELDVTANGQSQASNPLPCWLASMPGAHATPSYTGAVSYASAYAALDTREVTISDPKTAKVPAVDNTGKQTVDANGDPNFTTGPEPTIVDPIVKTVDRAFLRCDAFCFGFFFLLFL